MVRFFVLSVVILSTLFASELTAPVQSAIVVPWTKALVRISADLIMLFDSHVAVSGDILQSTTNGFALPTVSHCSSH